MRDLLKPVEPYQHFEPGHYQGDGCSPADIGHFAPRPGAQT